MLQSNRGDTDIRVLVGFAGDYQAALAAKADHPNGVTRLHILLLTWARLLLAICVLAAPHSHFVPGFHSSMIPDSVTYLGFELLK